MGRTVQLLISEMVQKSRVPVKIIATRIGKPYSTLMRELDPDDKGAKLGVEIFLPLMQLCDSIAPLRYMAAQMGYRISSTQDIKPSKPVFHEELLDTYEALVEYHRAMLRGDPVEAVDERREVLIRKSQEDFAAYLDRLKALEG